jgi:hypothetical protein
VGRLDECFLLTYAIDPERAMALVPAGLEPVTCRGVAFLNIVICHVDRMRPRLTPRALGVSHWYVAYRIKVRARLAAGTIEGLYFLRSDIDRRLLGAVGNLVTDFHFHHAGLQLSPAGNGWKLRVVNASHGNATLRLHRANGGGLLPGSPFSSVEERERVLKYEPYGLAPSGTGRSLRVTEVIRDEALWKEEPIEADDADWTYVRTLGVTDLQLVRATRVAPIDYIWRIGRKEDNLPAFERKRLD